MFSRFFIERPIFATVVSIILCLAGLVAWSALPVEQYPTITPVQVTVSAVLLSFSALMPFSSSIKPLRQPSHAAPTAPAGTAPATPGR